MAMCQFDMMRYMYCTYLQDCGHFLESMTSPFYPGYDLDYQLKLM